MSSEDNKKRRLEAVEADDEEMEPLLPKNDPKPYTCICFEGKFYTTDSQGYFIHNVLKEGTRTVPLYRCECDPQRNVVFTFIRHLTESEVLQLENVEDINCIENLAKHNKSLYY